MWDTVKHEDLLDHLRIQQHLGNRYDYSEEYKTLTDSLHRVMLMKENSPHFLLQTMYLTPKNVKISQEVGQTIVNALMSPEIDMESRKTLLVESFKVIFTKPSCEDLFEGLALEEMPQFEEIVDQAKENKDIETMFILKLAGVEDLDEHIEKCEA